MTILIGNIRFNMAMCSVLEIYCWEPKQGQQNGTCFFFFVLFFFILEKWGVWLIWYFYSFTLYSWLFSILSDQTHEEESFQFDLIFLHPPRIYNLTVIYFSLFLHYMLPSSFLLVVEIQHRFIQNNIMVCPELSEASVDSFTSLVYQPQT